MRTAFVSVVLVVLVVVLGFPTAAAADAAGDEVDELARSLAQQAEALATDDCTSACNALASMRRATERLCVLDPGRRCTDARATLDEATAKVRRACPQCPIPMLAPAPASPHEPAVAAAPPSEHRTGGCAGCTMGGTNADAATAMAFAVAALGARLRRRRQVSRLRNDR